MAYPQPIREGDDFWAFEDKRIPFKIVDKDGDPSGVDASDLSLIWELKASQGGGVLLTKASLIPGEFFFDPTEPIDQGYIIYDADDAVPVVGWHNLRQADVGEAGMIFYGEAVLKGA